jgi:hypothetical protein
LVDLFDGLLNGHGSPGLRLASWRPGKLSDLAHGRWGSLPRFGHWWWGSLLFARDGFRDGLDGLGRCLRPHERFLGGGSGCSPPASSVSTPAPPATPGRLRRFRLHRCFACWFRFLVGSHSYFKVP